MIDWVANAYDAAGPAWDRGPGRIYDRLAEVVVGCLSNDLSGRRVLDLGCGTGAASRALQAVGACPIGADLSLGMLAVNRERRPPSVAASAYMLPFADASFDAVVATFSLTHLPDPPRGFREIARVLRPGGVVLASTYAREDTHPVKGAAEQALREAGWEPGPDHEAFRTTAGLLGTAEQLRTMAAAGGICDATVRELAVDFPHLSPEALVSWRLGMAHHASFLTSLDTDTRMWIRGRALDLLGHAPLELRRSILVLTGHRH